ncbi:collagen alpha-1(I) chain-like [Motacilla alba alba]|uniref:collagen alpha-1(I) chain-like n=1 Tax=Motacilla alba alba TaxID=1094192 RepID=UPI0018D5A79C|nr:collagen alpha-1(I) chain-like [Motacilla alba alba]XP_038000891.1 collagen alpha-1(I) chain-like [Motacilla alba alba]XP_038000892.1 collagen alpha-1(I) chain-like [Motacilla alba alba]XP_038000893.1 collagen alpha-1(I) chain-like [Motacilla alba alba]XP_038000894.1 collagen alpha-1(I) chain-like [Motacilla alba alba]
MHCHALYLESSWNRKCPQDSGLFCCKCPSSPGSVSVDARSADVWNATWERWARPGPGSARHSSAPLQVARAARPPSAPGFPPHGGTSPPGGTGRLPPFFRAGCLAAGSLPVSVGQPSPPGAGHSRPVEPVRSEGPGAPTVHSPPGSGNSTLRPPARSPQGVRLDAKRGLVRWGLALRGWGQGSREEPKGCPRLAVTQGGSPSGSGTAPGSLCSAPRGPRPRAPRAALVMPSSSGLRGRAALPAPRTAAGAMAATMAATQGDTSEPVPAGPAPRWAQGGRSQLRAGPAAASKGGASTHPPTHPPSPAPHRSAPRSRGPGG